MSIGFSVVLLDALPSFRRSGVSPVQPLNENNNTPSQHRKKYYFYYFSYFYYIFLM